ncbi:MAG TPA: peptidase M23 [Micromonosporaceae bacterium]
MCTARTAVGEHLPSLPQIRRLLGRRSPAQVATAAAVLCCLGAGVGMAAQASSDTPGRPAAQASRTGEDRAASRSLDRAPAANPAGDAGAAAMADGALTDEQAAPAPPAPDGKAKPKEAKKLPPGHLESGPVAGLSDVQMNNAKAIVWTGVDIKMPRRALEIAVATALQESDLLNRASEVLPESKNHPHQGTGWDHDSVGLFQQRTSSGWGPVDKLMDPAYASQQFYYALMRVPGWPGMRLTDAAQAVQVSAFPEHYAKHEGRAKAIVKALTDVS